MEIVNMITQQENTNNDDNDEKEEECSITWSQASTHLNNFIKFAEHKTFLCDQDYMTLIRIHEKFTTAKYKSTRQQKITELFKKEEPSSVEAISGTVLTFIEYSFLIIQIKFFLVKFQYNVEYFTKILATVLNYLIF